MAQSKKLEPRLLRDKIHSQMRYWTEDQRKDFPFFIEKVAKTYVDVASYADMESSAHEKSEKGNDKPKRGNKQSKDKGNSGSGNRNDGQKEPNNTSKSKPKRRKSMEWSDPCLNNKYDNKHCIKDSKITLDNEMKRLLDKYH